MDPAMPRVSANNKIRQGVSGSNSSFALAPYTTICTGLALMHH